MEMDQRRAALRAALVSAAERVVVANGLGALRARDLAREAGCAVGAIYSVFPDLDTVILQVNMRTLELFEAEIGRSRVRGEEVDAVEELVRLAVAYLRFAEAHGARWRALFQHRSAAGAVPEWYRTEQARLFSYIEAPLDRLCPGLPPDMRAVRARSLFSCTHGLVSLGLDERLIALPGEVLTREVEDMVRALGTGLAGREGA